MKRPVPGDSKLPEHEKVRKMIVQLLFLTLFTMSSCRPSDPLDHCKDIVGTIWNGTHCICSTCAEESKELTLEKCDPGDDSCTVPVDEPVRETETFEEGSGASIPIDSKESIELTLEKCDPGDDACTVPVDELVRETETFEEGSGASMPIDSEESKESSFEKCDPGDDACTVPVDEPVRETETFEEGSGASMPIDSEESIESSFEKCDPGDDSCTDVSPSNKTCIIDGSSGCHCRTDSSHKKISIHIFNSTITNVIGLPSYLSSCCCPSSTTDDLSLNVTNSFISNVTFSVCKPCGIRD